MQLKQRQKGFTLVEIAVVLVIIGLLLGGVLKGQELISSARVRNLADQQSGIQAAYYGFQDRYRAVPGDMGSTEAENAIGVTTVACGGNGNGHLEDPANDWTESNAAWEHLSKAGFIKGSYEPDDCTTAPTAGNTDKSPLNVFSSPVVLAFAQADKFENGNAQRLVFFAGNNVPVDIARELDVKVDDGEPRSGTLRNATSAADPTVYQSGTNCVGDGADATVNQWNVQGNAQNCNPAFLF